MLGLDIAFCVLRLASSILHSVVARKPCQSIVGRFSKAHQGLLLCLSGSFSPLAIPDS